MMNKKWKTVAVFISSTFQDMHAERDYLVKEVFPELLAWCEKRRLHLYDIDLRWGITAEDSENHNTVAACLHNIDSCRPFFLCLLAQRRGWVPSAGDVSPETWEEYPQVDSMIGKQSVTEMEIEHALIAPMNRLYEGALLKQPPCRRAFFLFRKDDYLEGVPEEKRRVYLDSPENLEKIREFRRVIDGNGYPSAEYRCAYDPEEGRLSHFTAEGKELKDIILEALKKQILEEFPDHAAEAEGDDAASIQEEYIWRDEHSYYPQKEDMDALKEYLSSDRRKAVLITGKSGSGKTALLCAAVREYTSESHKAADTKGGTPSGSRARLLARFCGVSPQSGSLYPLLQSILHECGLPCPATERELFQKLDECLYSIAAQEKTILLIDALNQCQDGLRLLELLPVTLPQGLKIILSCKSEALEEETVERIRLYGNVQITPLKTACDEAFKRGMIDRFLSRYLKKLDEDHISLISQHEKIDSPLMVSLILSELRVFGHFEELSSEIAKYGGSIRDAFLQVLERLERESTDITGMPLSAAVFGLLSCARSGLDEEELLLAIRFLTGDPEEEVRPALRMLLRQVRPFLSRREKRSDFFHESFRLVSAERYQEMAAAMNRALAFMFLSCADPEGDKGYAGRDERAFNEYPWHLQRAGEEEEFVSLLLDKRFISRKIAVCGVRSLLEDYALTDDDSCRQVGGALRLSADVVQKDPSQLSFQLCGRLFGCQNTDPNIDELLMTLEEENEEYHLLPCNQALVSPEEGSLVIRHGDAPIVSLCIHMGDLAAVDEYSCIAIYDISTGEKKSEITKTDTQIRCLASDDRILFGGCADGTIVFWHTQSGSVLDTVKVGDVPVNDLSVQGDRLAAGSEDGSLSIVSIRERKLLSGKKTSGWPILGVSASGDRIAYGGLDQKISVQDGKQTLLFKTHSGYINKVVLSGDQVAGAAFFPRIFFRNLSTGENMWTDYTDGYTFIRENDDIFDSAIKKGPYIRAMVQTGSEVAVGTPYSVAVFPMKGAKAPAYTWKCSDVRALASLEDAVFAGGGNGLIYCFHKGTQKNSERKVTVMPVESIAVQGNHVAVLTGCSAEFYKTSASGDHIRLELSSGSRHTENLGYYRLAVPWKGGFGIGTFTHVNEWYDPDAEKWFTLYQSLMLQLGINTSDGPDGACSMAAGENCVMTLDKYGKLHFHYHRGNLDRSVFTEKANGYERLNVDTKMPEAKCLTALPHDRFAFIEGSSGRINIVQAAKGSITTIDRIDTGQQIELLQTAEGGYLTVCTSDGRVIGIDPDRARRLYEHELPGKANAVVCIGGKLYVSVEGRLLLTLNEADGRVISSVSADSEITALAVQDGWIYCGTEDGRFMVFHEKNPESLPEKRVRVVKEGPLRQKDRSPKAEKTPSLRQVKPLEAPMFVEILRIAQVLLPLLVSCTAVMVKGGFGEFLYAASYGKEPWSFLSWLLGLGLSAGRIIILLLLGMILMAVGGLQAEKRIWKREYLYRIINDLLIPVFFLYSCVPGLLLIRMGGKNETTAVSFSFFIAAGFSLLYGVFLGNLTDFLRSTAEKNKTEKTSVISMEKTIKIVYAVTLLLFFLGVTGYILWLLH